MAVFRFSRMAKRDLANIDAYTLDMWGAIQADHYLDQVKEICVKLADNPRLGAKCDHVQAGLRRMSCGKHIIYYRQKQDGILILRILHQQMMPEEHVIDDESQN